MPGSSLSQTEKTLLKQWSASKYQPNTLKSIEIEGETGLRGIKKLQLEFKYPITVISGRNGCGKSTILALAALAYHSPDGHRPANAKVKKQKSKTSWYYTFSDFFYKGHGDADLSGITISWKFLDSSLDKRITKQTQKWMHYNIRPERPVHFLGLSRATHPIEQRVLRNHFKQKVGSSIDQLDDNMVNIFTAIIGKTYTEASTMNSGRESTLRRCSSGSSYTGFNMGSGEDIVLGILSLIQKSPKGTLFAIDELEIGLFPEAQRLLMKHLQELALDKQLQIIITSHSEAIIDSVPRQARILLQVSDGQPHQVIYEPTTRMILGDMSGQSMPELVIFCEDTFASDYIRNCLSMENRRRVSIVPVGAKSELAKACAFNAISNNKPGRKYAILWDGDVGSDEAIEYLSREKTRFDIANNCSIYYHILPGKMAPEKHVVETLQADIGIREMCSVFRASEQEMRSLLTKVASLPDSHDIFHEFELKYDETIEATRTKLLIAYSNANKSEPASLNAVIDSMLRGEQAYRFGQAGKD